jgi:L-rhamnose isomerase
MAASIDQSYSLARERYAQLGVDTDRALATLKTIPISLHCWQGDDVGGFESDAGLTGGGIQATGNYPGKARTPEQLRSDIDKAMALIRAIEQAESQASSRPRGSLGY